MGLGLGLGARVGVVARLGGLRTTLGVLGRVEVQGRLVRCTATPSLRHSSTRTPSSSRTSPSTRHLRNVGIMAHVDAGKTTTSELLLFYAGYTKSVGNVDRGDTVLDFKDQERDRGITISSAAITFPWTAAAGKHQVNYIDTPGHVDFTMEVESALAVMDGGILVVDGSAGVEAQTMAVWRQADKYAVPRIAFVNKLDKPAACLAATLASIGRKLDVVPLVVQRQIGLGKNFTGVLDLVTMQAFMWRLGDPAMKVLTEEEVAAAMHDTYQAGKEARDELVEEAANFDDELASKVIEWESYDADPHSLQQALRRITLANGASPGEGGPPRALVTLLGLDKVRACVSASPLHWWCAPHRHAQEPTLGRETFPRLTFRL